MRNRVLVLVALTIALGTAAHAQSYTESILHSFTTANPTGTLTIDSAGNLYGALGAAVSGDKVVNNGTVFKLSPSGEGNYSPHLFRFRRWRGSSRTFLSGRGRKSVRRDELRWTYIRNLWGWCRSHFQNHV